MYSVHLVLLVALCAASIGVNATGTQSWIQRPQLVSFTFKGQINPSTITGLDILSGVHNGPWACKTDIAATWFAERCPSSDITLVKSVNNAGHEIALGSSSDSDITADAKCLNAAITTPVVGLRSLSGSISSDIDTAVSHGIVYDNSKTNNVAKAVSTYKMASGQSVAELTFMAPVEGDANWDASFRAMFCRNYNGARSPIILSVSAMVDVLGVSATRDIIKYIMAYTEVVALTVNQIHSVQSASSIEVALSMMDLCGGSAPQITRQPNTSAPTEATIPKPTTVSAAIATPTTAPTTNAAKVTETNSSSGNGATATTSPGATTAAATPVPAANAATPGTNGPTKTREGNAMAASNATAPATEGVAATTSQSGGNAAAPATEGGVAATSSQSGSNAAATNGGVAAAASQSGVKAASATIITQSSSVTASASNDGVDVTVPGSAANNGGIAAETANLSGSTTAAAAGAGNIAKQAAGNAVGVIKAGTVNGTIAGGLPANGTNPDAYTGITNTSFPTPTTSPSSATSYVPYALGFVGVCCAFVVFCAFKRFQQRETFPAVVTSGYAFEDEDRNIYDIEAASMSESSIGFNGAGAARFGGAAAPGPTPPRPEPSVSFSPFNSMTR